MSPAVYFVQFPHPGGEHVPSGVDMAWNTGPHKRKFMVAPGRYVNGRDDVPQADLTFWGEWEPPSRVVRRWPPLGRLPRALHRPYWVRPTTNGYRQNTDPWVWGDRMHYSNCKQTTVHGPTAMQRLTRGSVICFGSTLDGEFCVDTMFVVSSARAWDPSDSSAELEVGDAFHICTAASLTTGDCRPASSCNRAAQFTLYHGATVEDPVDGMFSFVPARLAAAPDARFARPAVQLPGLVNSASTQSVRGVNQPRSRSTVQQAWTQVVEQVLEADLMLAAHLDTPPYEAPQAVPPAARRRC